MGPSLRPRTVLQVVVLLELAAARRPVLLSRRLVCLAWLYDVVVVDGVYVVVVVVVAVAVAVVVVDVADGVVAGVVVIVADVVVVGGCC